MIEMQFGMSLGSWERGLILLQITGYLFSDCAINTSVIHADIFSLIFDFGQKSHVLGHPALLISNGAFLTTIEPLHNGDTLVEP